MKFGFRKSSSGSWCIFDFGGSFESHVLAIPPEVSYAYVISKETPSCIYIWRKPGQAEVIE